MGISDARSVWLPHAPICTLTEDKNHRQWQYNIHHSSNIIWSERDETDEGAIRRNSSHMSRKLSVTVTSKIAFPIVRRNPRRRRSSNRPKMREICLSMSFKSRSCMFTTTVIAHSSTRNRDGENASPFHSFLLSTRLDLHHSMLVLYLFRKFSLHTQADALLKAVHRS